MRSVRPASAASACCSRSHSATSRSTGPVAVVIGPETTLVVGGVLGSLLMVSLLFVPGVRDPERETAAEPLTGGDSGDRGYTGGSLSGD